MGFFVRVWWEGGGRGGGLGMDGMGWDWGIYKVRTWRGFAAEGG